MVTMNIVMAGFKHAPAKNKKDIKKIVVQHCRNQKTPFLSPPCEGGDEGVVRLKASYVLLRKGGHSGVKLS